MKTFIDIANQTFTFSSCEGCPARCCDGKQGSIFSELLLEEFEKVSKNFPILFTFGDLGFLKANVLLSNGKDFCPYIKDHRCIIYEERPNVCRNYPLSPTIENKIFIDDSCPAINQEFGKVIVQNNKVTKEFDNHSLHNYQERFLETYKYLEKYNDKDIFEEVIEINEIKFFKMKEHFNDSYLKLHIKSLQNLDKVLK
jgi:Fe-S-cluster containining protein